MQQSVKGQRGFTLGEVLATLGVLSVSMSLVVPTLDSVTRNNTRATAINELVATMHAARSEAITRNVQVAVCPSINSRTCTNTDWEAGWIRFTDADRDQRLDDGEQLLGVSPAITGLEIRSETFGRAFGYQPSGRVVAPDSDQHFGDFTFCDGRGDEFAQVVLVNPAGLPALTKRLANGSDPHCQDT